MYYQLSLLERYELPRNPLTTIFHFLPSSKEFKGASGCAGGARTPHCRDPYPKTTGNITPQPTIHQERQSPTAGQVAQKEPLDEPGGPPLPRRSAGNRQKPQGSQSLKRPLPPPFPPRFLSGPDCCGPHIREAGSGPPRVQRRALGVRVLVTLGPGAHRAQGCRRRARARGPGWRSRGCPASRGG